jgi:hypothetical protein
MNGRIPALVIGAGLLLAMPAAGQPTVGGDTVTAAPLSTFQGTPLGGRIGGLIWRGGLVLDSELDTFGGLSGAGFVSSEQHVVFASDRGNFISGQLIYGEDKAPLGLVGVRITPIQNTSGAPLPRAFARDAEALAVLERDGVGYAVRVGFENLTRVADFGLRDHAPEGAAREVVIPAWLSQTRTNESIEAVCIAPPASPIAGSTLLLTEGVLNTDGLHAAFLLGRNDRGPLRHTASPGVNPTDCAFLPNGDLLVLERGIALLSFTMTLKRVAAADVRPDATMTGEVLLETTGGDIDNMEAVAVHVGPDGETRIALISDNNFNDWERTLLLEFTLAD